VLEEEANMTEDQFLQELADDALEREEWQSR
jgi:hypothetical protein